jgi:hypothetical protein
MTWHFFKKDVRLLWPMVLALASVQALSSLRTVLLGHFGEPRVLYLFAGNLPTLVFIGIVVVAISAVQQDPVPGDRQDWLTRPLRRRDVWLSKVLFVVLLVLAPIFVIDIAEQLALHLPLLTSMSAAATRTLVLLGVFALPALAVGSITRSFAEALIFCLVSSIALTLLFMLTLATVTPGTVGLAPGVEWVQIAAAQLVMLAGVVATLSFQYTHRRTIIARVIALSGVVLALAVLLALPPAAAMAVQRWKWGGTEGGAAITLRLTPDRPLTATKGIDPLPLSTDPGTQNMAIAAAGTAYRRAEDRQYAQIHLPVQVAGMAPGNILYSDQIALRITAADGALYFEGTEACIRSGIIGAGCRPNRLEVRAVEPRPNPAGESGVAELYLPKATYERIKNLAVRLDLRFSLSIFEPAAAQLIGTGSGARQLSGLDSCATRIDSDGDEVELRCLTNQNLPSCISAALEDPRSGRRNPEMHSCYPNYSPFPLHMPLDVLSAAGLSLPFHDSSGIAHYPVDVASIAGARIRLTAYEPADHFRRALVVPSIRLVDWEAPATAGE